MPTHFLKLNHYFFKNKEIDSLYFTESLISFGSGLISVFVPIYFWILGFPLWQILFFYFLHSLYFVTLALALLPVLKRLSDKMMIFLSLPFLFGYFLLLGQISNNSSWLYVTPLLSALGALFFNVGYHLDFTCSADGDCIGRSVGTRHFISSLVRFSSPLLGGLLIAWSGFNNAFILSAIIMIIAVVPLFFFPRRKIASFLGYRQLFSCLSNKKLIPFNISCIGYAVEERIALIIWPLFVFLAIGNIKQFGGVISLGLLASALINYLIGYFSDKGERRHLFTASVIFYFLGWVAAMFVRGIYGLIGLNVYGNMAGSALYVAWGSQYYHLAKAVPGVCAFILSREILYNLARMVFLPLLMILSVLFPSDIFFRLSFAVAALSVLFYFFANRTHTSSFKD